MRVPSSTYRLQINADFPFSRVRELSAYFHQLGVGDLYFSPVFQARPRSPHGYDVTNPARFSRDIGDEEQFAALRAELRAHGIGIILDIVPNHMAASEENPWWRDLLEHGRAALSTPVFDVAWDAPGSAGRLVLPILGRPLDEAIDAREIAIALRHGGLSVTYFQRTLPLDPATYALVLANVPNMPASTIAAAEAPGFRRADSHELREQRRAAAESLKQSLHEWANIDDNALNLENHLRDLTPAVITRVLAEQPYRLEFWRTGLKSINYRRFFDIVDLVGVRVENPAVFAVMHSLMLDLVQRDLIDGVRVDHVDGLRDPGAYLGQLRAAVGDLYVAVEKILAPKEELREAWPVEGTTGYDFVGLIAGLFCEPDGLARLTESYERKSGSPSFAEIVYEKKKLVIGQSFVAELNGLTEDLVRSARTLGLELDHDTAAACIVEVSASLQVYRTYIDDLVDACDRSVIKAAMAAARHRESAIPDQVYALMRGLLLGDDLPPAAAHERAEFIANWQQFTGPVMAKGLEDTALYTYNRLLPLSEVGAHPYATVASTSELHEILGKRSQRWPATLNASSTHDTKRSEDVRARLQVLTEIPDRWNDSLERWSGLAAQYRKDGVPAFNEEILIYQTLLGIWPLDPAVEPRLAERLETFLRKAAREAKTHSSWLDPDEVYEQALFDFTRALMRDDVFLADFRELHELVALYGALNSLSQLVIKLGAPGVPDFYQGNESWNFSLVDPDNRRPVDFNALAAALEMLPANVTHSDAAEMLRSWRDGRIKLHLTRTGLHLRKAKHDLFALGGYAPVAAHGRRAANIVAFARHHLDEWALIVAGRFYSQVGTTPVGNAWRNTTLELPEKAPRAWRNALTNEVTDGSSLETVFATLPFAILTAAQ